ncbi:hypothetical protein [Latilactobacillus sakei]|nr:hypothetical protein [Latilactobacillus sakei]
MDPQALKDLQNEVQRVWQQLT